MLRLDSNTFFESDISFNNVKSLIMNRANLGAREMGIISKVFPAVETLVLRGFRMDAMDLFRDSFRRILKLNLGKSQIRDFSQIEILSTLENLQELKLYNNPLVSVPDVTNLEGFKSLRRLNLAATQIGDLNSISNLNTFPVLTELRIADANFSIRFKDHTRKLLISYLPNIEEINGSKATSKERATAERQFLRDFNDPYDISRHVMQPTKDTLFEDLTPEEIPVNVQVFERLHIKHGSINKFAEINLAPPTEALIHFQTEEGEEKDHVVYLS